MKLYLSSFRLGDHPERLVALLPPGGRVAVICNSIVPHLDSPGHPETQLLAEVAELYDRPAYRISPCATARPSSSTVTTTN
jgi:hypothetical protein